MEILSYKCPCCSAPLAFSGEENKLKCSSCGNTFEPDAIKALSAMEQEDDGFSGGTFDMQTDAYDETDPAQTQGYTCSFCGAQLVTDANTTATECAYCGSPAILPARLSGAARPKALIPFTVTKEQATRAFTDYFKGKKLIPNIFTTTQNRIAEIRQLYVPYWLFSCNAQAHMTFEATQTNIHSDGDWQVTHTRHFLVRRVGSVAFARIPVDASVKLDDRISESIEPYNAAKCIDFTPAALAGAMADCADADKDACLARVEERLDSSTEDAFRSTVVGYDTVSVRSASIHTEDGVAEPVLFPIWLITTRKTEKGQERTYTFAINGQTGRLSCDVPYSKKQALKWLLGLTASITCGGYLILLILAAVGLIGGI